MSRPPGREGASSPAPRSKFADQADFEQPRRSRDRLAFAYFRLAEQTIVGRLQAKQQYQLVGKDRQTPLDLFFRQYRLGDFSIPVDVQLHIPRSYH